MFKKTRNSISQHPNSLDPLSAIGTTDLTEDQMQAYAGGEIRGTILLFSTLPEVSDLGFRFPSDGPGRGGTVSVGRNLLAHELTHLIQ
ncbi:MAG: hypothetical protein ACHWZW_10075 [Spirulina sp.]